MGDNNISINAYWPTGNRFVLKNDAGDIVVSMDKFVVLSADDWEVISKYMESNGTKIIHKDIS